MTSLILFCIFRFSLIYDNLIFAFSSWMVWQISSVVSFHSDLGICNRGRKTFLRKFLLSFSLWDTAAAAWFFVVNLLKEAATFAACRTSEHSHFKRKQVGVLWTAIFSNDFPSSKYYNDYLSLLFQRKFVTSSEVLVLQNVYVNREIILWLKTISSL